MRAIGVFAALLLAAPAIAQDAGTIYIGPDATRGAEQPVVIDSLGEVETTFRAWGSPGTKSKPSRWSAKVEVFVRYAKANPDDVLQMQVFKGRKALGPATPCQPKATWKEAELLYYECTTPKDRDWDAMFKTSGEHTIKLSYKQPIEGKEFKNFAELNVHVMELKKGSSNDPTVAWGTDHDMKMPVSTLEEKTDNAGRGVTGEVQNALSAAQRNSGIPYLLVHTWLKADKRVPRTKLTCMYNGERIAEASDAGGTSFSEWSYKKKGSSDRDDHKWDQQEYFLYNLHPRPGPGGEKGTWSKPQHWLNENPGEYRCVVTGDGEILKELYFTVGEDGEIVKPECQLSSMNSLRTVTLLTTKDIKPASRSYDAKRGQKQGYEGRVTWQKGCPPTH